MAIKPINKRVSIRNFITFDLEWAKGTKGPSRAFKTDVWRPELRMAGVYDGERFRWYKTIKGFLRAELTHKNRGKWFYAHAGGLADMIFLLEILADDPRYEVRASFSGSSAIIVHVIRGKHRWTFVDSYWLIRAPLAKIGVTLGFPKGDVTSFDNAPLAELVEYNERDCVLLHRAITEFQIRLLNLGGQLQMTQASCAMFLFRRRFLTQEIRTSEGVNKPARDAYFASRVEPFRASCRKAYYYDINSSFPYAMTQPVPGNLKRFGTRIPTKEGAIYIADVTVLVPEMYFPSLPKRYKNSVFFPIGSWRGHFSNIDIESMIENGGEVLKVHRVMEFEPFTQLKDYAETLYDLRKASDNDVDRMVYKLLLNSLYGKFAEQSVKQGLILHPKTPDVLGYDHWPTPDEFEHPESDCELVFPGAWLVQEEIDVPHAHVPISMHITAQARKTLYDYMNQCEVFHYCDTDGFCTTEPGLKTSNELGALKKELDVYEGLFVRPKVYRLNDRVRAKGFSLKPDRQEVDPKTGLKYEELGDDDKDRFSLQFQHQQFQRLMNGESIEMRRFGRIRETFSRAESPAEIHPTERIIRKALRNTARPKRCWLEDGNTRPWHVEELEE